MNSEDIKKYTFTGIKMLSLAVIVFLTVTMVPNKVISMYNRILIALVVTLIFALLDYIRGSLGLFKNWLCDVACDCDVLL